MTAQSVSRPAGSATSHWTAWTGRTRAPAPLPAQTLRPALQGKWPVLTAPVCPSVNTAMATETVLTTRTREHSARTQTVTCGDVPTTADRPDRDLSASVLQVRTVLAVSLPHSPISRTTTSYTRGAELCGGVPVRAWWCL